MEPIDEPLHLFQAFHEAKKALPSPQKESYATYQQETGGSYNGVWMAYMEIWRDADLSIANAINQLNRYSRDLQAWDVVTKSMNDDGKFRAFIYFVDPLSALALNLPYVIQQRLFYATAHLCHQANRAKLKEEWKDDLPNDKKINGKICDQYGAGWPHYPAFRATVNTLNDAAHRAATQDYREKYTHRLPPGVLIGLGASISREKEPGSDQVSYAFGGPPPLSLATVTQALGQQRNAALFALACFRALVQEHLALIGTCASTGEL